MSIMPHLPSVAADEVHHTLAEVWPLYTSVQVAARAGIYTAIEVQPSSIRVTIEVSADRAQILPDLLADIADPHVASTADGRHAVVGRLYEGTITIQVVTPPHWVTRAELDVLLEGGHR